MTVAKFQQEFESFKEESNEIYSQIKPLLKRLKVLVRKAKTLENQGNSCKGLYESILVKNNPGTAYRTLPKGWDISILFRLNDFQCLDTDEPMSGSVLECIDNVLYNMKHTKFRDKTNGGEKR